MQQYDVLSELKFFEEVNNASYYTKKNHPMLGNYVVSACKTFLSLFPERKKKTEKKIIRNFLYSKGYIYIYIY